MLFSMSLAPINSVLLVWLCTLFTLQNTFQGRYIYFAFEDKDTESEKFLKLAF